MAHPPAGAPFFLTKGAYAAPFFCLARMGQSAYYFHAGAGPAQLGASKMENENAFLQQLAGALVALIEPEIEKRFQTHGDALESEIESQIEEMLPAAVEDRVATEIEDKLDDAIEGALDSRLDDAGVEDEVAARIDKAVAAALPGVLRAALVDLFKPVATIREDGALVFMLSSHWGK
jgi:hypothetical protein